jgi:hypothetical protein
MKEVVERCITHKISIVQYMICYLLYNDEQAQLVNYCVNNLKIETKEFLWLIDEGYLEEVKNRKLIEINDLVLTNKFASEILKIVDTKNITFETAFNQLRDHYPVKAGNSERRLQGDVERCKRLYKNIIIKNGKLDEELHSVILQCINYEIKMKTKSKSLEYFKLLTTWLHQKEYELYYDDVINIIKKSGAVDKESGNGNGFVEDV